MGQNRELI
nr:unnamed protein product [Callosobruchus analis]